MRDVLTRPEAVPERAGGTLATATVLTGPVLSPSPAPMISSAVSPNMVLIETALLIIGAGLGLNTGPVNTVAVASVPPARSGTASGLVNTSRMVGATLGVAVLGSLFAVHAGD